MAADIIPCMGVVWLAYHGCMGAFDVVWISNRCMGVVWLDIIDSYGCQFMAGILHRCMGVMYGWIIN